MGFDFRRRLIDEDGEVDEEAASIYIDELCQEFAASPEGEALAERGGEPGHYLDFFLDCALRYTRANPSEMDARDVREALDVMAEKITARPEDLDRTIPELEAYCDFVGRAYGLKAAAGWKRQIRSQAAEFRRAVGDPRRWGMAKSMMMEGLARGYDLSTREGIDEWMLTTQAEQLARLQGELGGKPAEGLSLLGRLRRALGFGAPKVMPSVGEEDERPLYIAGLAGGEPDIFPPGFGGRSERRKEKSRRKQANASRRRNRR